MLDFLSLSKNLRNNTLEKKKEPHNMLSLREENFVQQDHDSICCVKWAELDENKRDYRREMFSRTKAFLIEDKKQTSAERVKRAKR